MKNLFNRLYDKNTGEVSWWLFIPSALIVLSAIGTGWWNLANFLLSQSWVLKLIIFPIITIWIPIILIILHIIYAIYTYINKPIPPREHSFEDSLFFQFTLPFIICGYLIIFPIMYFFEGAIWWLLSVVILPIVIIYLIIFMPFYSISAMLDKINKKDNI